MLRLPLRTLAIPSVDSKRHRLESQKSRFYQSSTCLKTRLRTRICSLIITSPSDSSIRRRPTANLDLLLSTSSEEARLAISASQDRLVKDTGVSTTKYSQNMPIKSPPATSLACELYSSAPALKHEKSSVALTTPA